MQSAGIQFLLPKSKRQKILATMLSFSFTFLIKYLFWCLDLLTNSDLYVKLPLRKGTEIPVLLDMINIEMKRNFPIIPGH